MKLSKNLLWILGLAIFLGATMILSDLILAIFAPVIAMAGLLGLIVVLLLVFLGLWVMKKGSKP